MKQIPAIVLFVLLAAGTQAQVVINEIMYRPTPTTVYPENTGLEYIELHNPTAAAVDVSGWAITSGTSFTFSPGVTIPAGGYRVVAANPSLLESAFGISGVLGPWGAGSTLANGGEKITLSKPGASAGSFDEVDSVRYASEGDWALRIRETGFGGWDWFTTANGAGRSLELRNPALSNDNGQNWSASSAIVGGTPGAQNSVITGNIPPIIEDVTHSPAVPTATESVTISCRVRDESAPQFLSATLFWRDATGATPGAFQQQPMAGDGSGEFRTVLAPKANLTIVEFYVRVTDGVETRTWPAATSEGQTANCQYQVTNEALSATDAYYFLVLTGPENAAYNTAAPDDSANNRNNRQFNTTLVVQNGADTTIRYRSGIRFRGNSSRMYQFKPLRVSLPNDDAWDDVTDFNLNPRSSFLQFAGMRMHQLAGVRAPDAIPVKPRRNGVEYSTSTGATPDYGFWAREEDVGGDFVNKHWPEASGGGVYKKVRPDRYWRNIGWTVPALPSGSIDGWEKQNNSGANDWSDLTTFFATAQSAAAPHFPGAPAGDAAQSTGNTTQGNGAWNSTAFTSAELATFENVADLDQWARWFAVMTILQDFETNISNGEDDDYGVYFAPNLAGQRRANLITHDMDTIFGLGDNPQAFNARGLFDSTESGSVFRPLLPLLGTATVAGNAVFRQKYFDAIRELYGTVFNANTATDPNPSFYQFIDSHLTGWAPAATISGIKTWMSQRQGYLLGLIGSGTLTPAAATSSASLASVPGTLMIHELLAHNVATHLNGGTYPDIIELYNAGSAAVDLAGFTLTDDPLIKTKFVFPIGTTIAAGGYLIVYADSNVAAPGLHTGFALDAEGDAVYLYNSGQALLDSITYGIQAADFSIGRTGPARDVWTLCTPTIGAVNTPVAAFGAPGGLKINEWAGNHDYLLEEDFLEVFNPSTQPVALGLMTLTDDFINYPAKSAIPPLSFVAPGEFVAFRAAGNGATEGDATELPFSIDANFGYLALVGQNGTIVDRVDIVAQPDDTSRGRVPDGGGAIATFGLPTNVPTPGAPNANPPASVLALINNLRISELLYAPTNLEYLELHNIGSTPLDLSGVRFTKGIEYTFDAGITLAPGGYLVICRDRAVFQAQFGAAVPLAPRVFVGSLDNAGERIALQPPSRWNVNILNFTYDPTWFAPDTSAGYSLTVINDTTTAARDWDEKSTWSPSPTLNGTPGADSPPTITSPLSATAYIGDPFAYQITGTKTPTSYNAVPLPGGLTVNPATGLISGTPTTTGAFNVTISATNGTGTGSRTLALTVAPPPSPTILSASTANGIVGRPFTYQIVANNGAFEYTATNLPPGLNINLNTGLISGTPSQNGTSNVSLTATNANGTGSKQLTLTIILPPAPGITSGGTASGVVGDAFTYQIIASNTPSSYAASGLPSGLAVNSSNGLISGAPTVSGTFNIVLSATNIGGTGTKPLTLAIATSGPLANFTWSTVANPQQAGVPFAVTLVARDAQGRTVTTANGSATVSGQLPGVTAGIVLITECGTGNLDYFEIQNVGNAPANTAGWFIVPNNAGGAGGGMNAVNAAWALPATIAPGAVIAITENTAGIYPNPIDWNSGGFNRTGWCMLCDNTGAVRDFVAWGYNAANISAINVPSVPVGATTYTNITVPGTQWSGNGAGTQFNSAVKSRTGTADNNTSANWITGNSEANKGLQNTGLTVPFIPPPVTIGIVPGVVALTNGMWSGTAEVGQAATALKLIARNAAAQTGSSNTFDVLVSSAPVITSSDSAIAVVGGLFSYQILATNAPASYAATGVPAGLALNPDTGLISGTPTTGGSSTIALSATNVAGSGQLSLFLDVQADGDGDGMGDAWETANGLNSTVNDAAGDRDGDGQSNFAEWQAGTLPNNSNSRFQIVDARFSENTVTLTWNAVRGKRYRVFSRTDLSGGSWSEITTGPVIATTTTASFIHSSATGGQRFYRVGVEP